MSYRGSISITSDWLKAQGINPNNVNHVRAVLHLLGGNSKHYSLQKDVLVRVEGAPYLLVRTDIYTTSVRRDARNVKHSADKLFNADIQQLSKLGKLKQIQKVTDTGDLAAYEGRYKVRNGQ